MQRRFKAGLALAGALLVVAGALLVPHGARDRATHAHAQERSEGPQPVWSGLVYGNRQNKVLVTFVMHGSPADIAGIETGIAIDTIDGHEVPNAEGLHEYIHAGKEGQTLELVGHDAANNPKKYSLTLGKRDTVALLKTSLKDGAQALASLVAPCGDGWARHQGPRTPDDLGSGLTALAVRALAQLPPEVRKPHEPLIERALAVLMKRAKNTYWVTDEEALAGQSYETYATAETLLALVALHGVNHPDVAFIASGLAARQLGPVTPWPGVDFSTLDWQYGGFPFEDRATVRRTDLRVTVAGTAIALEALHAAGMNAADPVMVHARRYLARVQNFDRTPDPFLKELVDGGFPESGILSKAGAKDVKVKVDGEERDRRIHRSYGSATVDGLAALFYTGSEKERIAAATDWVRNHFDLTRTPGLPPPPENPRQRNPFEQGIRFYYVASLARALDLVGENPFNAANGSRSWPEALLDTLLADQSRSGAWKNHVPVMDEDNEAVATSFALLALERAYPHLVEK